MNRRKLPTTTEITTEPLLPCGCDGSGAIRYIERDHPDTNVPIGHGLHIGPGATWGTNLCECRNALPPREGKARWWTSKVIHESEWAGSVFEPYAEISVRGEVPISDENYVLIRSEDNFYYPTSVSVDFSSAELHWLFPDEARDLAQKLIAAADAADAYDNV